MKNFLELNILFLSFMFHIGYLFGHPQCLDFNPPFKPTKKLEFCETYSEYGCCNERKDKDMAENYAYIREISLRRNFSDESCFDFARDIMCLPCHPYAAHVFDAEDPQNKDAEFSKWDVSFPGLCKNYCLSNFDRCRDIVVGLASRYAFREFVKSANATTFCSWAEIPDLNYCYPDVNTVEISTKKLKTKHENKLCVQQFSNSIFSNALLAVHANDKSNRLFVGEQRGLVYVILQNGTRLHKPFLNLTEQIINSGSPWDERGFLGMVFHPQYKTNGRFFVYYSAAGKDLDRRNYSRSEWYWNLKHRIRISEFIVDPHNPNIADHSSELPLLEVDQPEPNHNGGMIMFGKEDGYLYIFVGDGGGRGDNHGIYGNGLLMSTFLGKVLRINVDVENEFYGIPSDNPFINNDTFKPEIYAYGIRNIWRCSLDGVTNRMFCGDVGQNKFEEIDIIKKGRNYGWRAYEGFSCFDEDLCKENLTNLEFPILTYGHDIGRSIVGGYVYRGCGNPNMYGKYFFADTMNGKIFVAEENVNNGTWRYDQIEIGDSSFCNNGLQDYHHRHILSFGESESGEIFILSTQYPHPQFQGSVIYKLIDPVQRGNPDLCNFKVNEAKPLKKIKRRKIWEKYLREKENKEKASSKEIKKNFPPCQDERNFCHIFTPSKKRGKPLMDCLKLKRISFKYCKKTCGFCPNDET